MVKISAHEVGAIALVILKYKIGRQGIDLRPAVFAQFITKRARLIGCPREELLAFYNKYLVPEILRNCELTRYDKMGHEVSEREAKIAYRLLKMGYFWNIRGLRDEVNIIVEKTQLGFEEVAAIVTNIAKKHLRDEFVEGEAAELDIQGGFELN